MKLAHRNLLTHLTSKGRFTHMNTTTDSRTGQVTRTITSGNRVIVQVSRPNGEWWNIRTYDARTGK